MSCTWAVYLNVRNLYHSKQLHIRNFVTSCSRVHIHILLLQKPGLVIFTVSKNHDIEAILKHVIMQIMP